MKSRTKKGSYPVHVVLSDDPKVIAIQGIIKGASHFAEKGLSWRHLKVLLGVEKFITLTKNRAYPNPAQIASMIGVHPDDFAVELEELVTLRYLHKMHPTYGELIYTYKLGSMGGTMMRQILPGGKLKPGGQLSGEPTDIPSLVE